MSLIETPKYVKRKCVDEFVHDLIQGNGVESFRKYSLNGELDKYHIRGMAWKIFMEVLPETDTLEQWVESIDKLRKDYKTKAKSLLKAQKFKGDPLSGMGINNSDTGTWNTYYQDNDTKKLINLDLDRTFQELCIFHETKIKSNLADILFLWNKENLDVGYQQGMNDILAVTFLGLYPCYFKNNKKLGKNEILKISSEQISAIQNAEDIYDFFHDEDELYSDLYYCFSRLMKRGLKELFETFKGTEKRFVDYKKYELFSNQLEPDPADDMQNPLNIRCTLIIKEKLKSIDPDLYQHFKKIGLNCGIFLQRWLKCMFDREFDLKDIFIIWDAIFATPDARGGYGLVFLDYVAISMIIRIRKELLKCDQNECFATLFKYPPINNISELVVFANNLQIAVEEMLHGKRSNFLDKVLEIAPINLNSKNNLVNDNFNMNMQSMQYNNNLSGNMSFFPENYNQNNEEIKENKGFFKNAMSSVGGFFSNVKQKIEKKIDEKNRRQNNNNGKMLGEIHPIQLMGNMSNMNNMNNIKEMNMNMNVNINMNQNQITSIKDCARRIDNLFNKYGSYFSSDDVNEYKAIVQYLNNNS